MYIYDMPYIQRRNLCTCLDRDRNLFQLLTREFMGYDELSVHEFLNSPTPTDSLLTSWGNQNHSVLELFFLLHKIKHYRAMTFLKSLVPLEYHRLILEPDVAEMLREVQLTPPAQQESLVLNVDHERGSPHQQVSPPGLARPGPSGSGDNNQVSSPQPLQQQRQLLLSPAGPPGTAAGTSRVASSAISCVTEVAGSTTHIPYEELELATNNWDKNAILGQGGFGTVYAGVWRYTRFAIKRINLKSNNAEAHVEQIRQSITELKCLNAYRHDNILPLYGFSIGGPDPCLVYKFMSGGNLLQRLRSSNVLTWSKRHNIAIETARGLQYLHTCSSKPLVHGDIKPANILLDENDKPKIGDFGLAREGPNDEFYTHMLVSRVHGTRFYLPDEFMRGRQFSPKVDTFSFGVVLLEVATNLSVFDKARKEQLLKDHVLEYDQDKLMELKDARAPDGEEIFSGLIEIAKKCVVKVKDRPTMVQVLEKLEAVNTDRQ